MEETLSPAQAEVNQLVENGLQALDDFLKLDQDQVDYIVAKCSVAALDKHGELAKLAIEETKRGVLEDKATKNLFACEYVVNHMRHLKSVGRRFVHCRTAPILRGGRSTYPYQLCILQEAPPEGREPFPYQISGQRLVGRKVGVNHAGYYTRWNLRRLLYCDGGSGGGCCVRLYRGCFYLPQH